MSTLRGSCCDINSLVSSQTSVALPCVSGQGEMQNGG